MTPAAVRRDVGMREPALADVLRCAWPALVLAAACLLPFLNKAFLIDDPHFLAMARQILKHPLHPMDFDVCWITGDYVCMKAYALTPGNALMGYALVPTILGRSAEWVAHSTQLLFAWVAILAMCSLVLRLGWSRWHATAGGLLLVSIPPFLPMASTAMPDVLALATGVLALERLAAWKAQGKWTQGLAAGITLGLAGIARAHLALLLPLAAFFLMESLDPREVFAQVRRNVRLWTPVLVGAVVLLAIILATRERGLALGPPVIFRGLEYIPRNLRSYLIYLCFPLPLAACWMVSRWITVRRRITYSLCALAAIALLVLGRHTGFLAFISACVLGDLLVESWKKRDQSGLFLMLWLLIPLPIVYYGHFPIKYLLPCMPAVILICFRLGVVVPARISRIGCILLIVITTIYSVLILRSDAEYAEFGRLAMDRLVRPHVAAGQRVWYGGHYSAYWYAPLAGAELFVTRASTPAAGDLLVVGVREAGSVILAHFPKRTLVETLSHKYTFGRTMYEGIGLYTNWGSTWLWGFGDSGEDDRFELWRID